MAIEIETTTSASEGRQERVSRAGSRAHTECINRLSKRALKAGREETAEYALQRPFSLDETFPSTYGECLSRRLGSEEKPCHFVRCAYHLAIEVSEETGAIKINFPDALDGDALDMRALPATCALHLSAEEHTLEEVGAIVNITRERARQIETKGLESLKALSALAAYADELRGDVTRGVEPEDTRIGASVRPRRVPPSKSVGRVQPYGRGRYHAPTLQPFDRDRARAASKVHNTAREYAEGGGFERSLIDPPSELQESIAFGVRDGAE